MKGKEAAAYDFGVCSEGLDVDGLDLVVAGPDDLAAAVHRGHGLLAAKLHHRHALVVAQGDPERREREETCSGAGPAWRQQGETKGCCDGRDGIGGGGSRTSWSP